MLKRFPALIVKVQSAYKPIEPSGRRLSRISVAEATKSISNPAGVDKTGSPALT